MELRKIAAAAVASSVFLAGLATASGQTEVPRDWRRLKVPPVPGSREFACNGLTSTAWRMDFRDGMLKATHVNLRERIQDQLPYEVDFSDAYRRDQLFVGLVHGTHVITGVKFHGVSWTACAGRVSHRART